MATTCAEAGDPSRARHHLATAARVAAADLSESEVPPTPTPLAEGLLNDVIQDLISRFENDALASLRLGVAAERAVVGVPGSLAIAVFRTGPDRYLTLLETD